MKKIIILSLCFVCCSIAAAQTYSLQQLLDSARQNNIALRNARRSVEAAGQQRKEAFTKYFPNVSGTGLWFNANRGMAKMEIKPSELIPTELSSMASQLSQTIPAELSAMLAQMIPAEALSFLANPISMTMMKNGTMASIMAMQPVFAGGQIVNGNKLARVGEDVSRLQLQLSDNEVEKTVTQYYWQVVSLEEKMKTIDAADSLLSDIAKNAEIAVKVVVANRNDLLQVQLRQNDLASQRLRLRNGIGVVKALLGQYCGLKPTPDPSQVGGEGVYSFDIALPISEQQTVILPFLDREGQGESLSSLPEYQLLEKQVEATNLQRKIAVGQNLPTVAVGAGYNYHNFMDNDRTFGMIFATVNIPISDWWGGSHAIKRKKIEYEKAVDQLADNTELLRIRLLNTRNSVSEAYQQLLLADKGIEQAAENLRLNREYYKAGTCTMSNLLEAQLLYQQAQDSRTDAWADYQNRLLDYRQASGE